MALTDLKIKNLSPKTTRYEVADGNGLYIRIETTGSKAWVFRYVFDGARKRMVIGRYPGISLAQAREKHGAAMIDIQNGVDPGAKQAAEKAKRKAAPTFQDLLNEYWDVELSKSPSAKERRRLVEKDGIPAWRNKKVADITRRDAVLLVDKVRERAPIGANRFLGVLVRMFNFAAERGIIDHSPLTGIRRKKEKPRVRVLTDQEIKLFWAGMDLGNKDIDLFAVSKLALKMILLTGQRPGEVAGMRWDEIDGDVWNIPASRMKNNELQRVPLCGMALETIEMAKVYSGENTHMFGSSHNPEKPIMRQALTKAIGRHWREMGIVEAFTPHDLRRTLRTRLAELGVSDIVAERVLGHRLQGIMAVYNQHSYDIEKRQALTLWETRLKEITGQAGAVENVIRFSPRKG